MREKHSLEVIILDLSSVSKLVLIFDVDLRKLLVCEQTFYFKSFLFCSCSGCCGTSWTGLSLGSQLVSLAVPTLAYQAQVSRNAALPVPGVYTCWVTTAWLHELTLSSMRRDNRNKRQERLAHRLFWEHALSLLARLGMLSTAASKQAFHRPPSHMPSIHWVSIVAKAWRLTILPSCTIPSSIPQHKICKNI